MAIFDFSPGATDVTAVANLITAIINRRAALEADPSDYAKRQLANLEEIEAPFMFLIRKWNKLIGAIPAQAPITPIPIGGTPATAPK